MTTPEPVSLEDASRQARELVQNALDENDEAATNTIPKPAWIHYYESQLRMRDSHYYRGSRKAFDHFEAQVMEKVEGDGDRYFSLIQQHPQACALIYPDASKKMRIIHHLTCGVHNSVVVVGVDGLGITSEVKALNLRTFISPMDIKAPNKKTIIPKVKDFVERKFESLTPDSVKKGGTEPDETMEDFFEKIQPFFMIHPLWLTLLYSSIGGSPEVMAQTVVKKLGIAVRQKWKGFGELDSLEDYYCEIYGLLVYLWACHHEFFSIKLRGLLKSHDDPSFHLIQGNIIRRVFETTSTPPRARGGPEVPREDRAVIDQHKSSSKLRSNSTSPQRGDRRARGSRHRMGRSESRRIETSRSRSVPRERPHESRKSRIDDHGRRRNKSLTPPRRYSPRGNREERPERRSRSRSERRKRTSHSLSREPRRRSSRSDSRERRRRRSRSPPRFDVYEAHRLADAYLNKKGKTIISHLTPAQQQAFTLLSAHDWDDERPRMNNEMELILDQTRLSTAIRMMRSTMRQERWLGLIPDSGISQFLQNGILAEDDSIMPSGFSMFYIRPRTFDLREIESEKSRRTRLSAAFGKDGLTEDQLDELAKLEFYIPRTYQDLEVMIDTGIRWLDLCTRKRSIASEGLRKAEKYLREYREQFHRIIADDPEFPIKMIHSLDKAVNFVGEELAYRYKSIREGRRNLEFEMVESVRRHLRDVRSGCHNFPVGAVPKSFLTILRQSHDSPKGEKEEEHSKKASPRWHSKNLNPVDEWSIPSGKTYKDVFPTGSDNVKGWPRFPHHRSEKEVPFCIRYHADKKCNARCRFAHVSAKKMTKEDYDTCDHRFKEAYG